MKKKREESKPVRLAAIDWETTGLLTHPAAGDALQPRAIEFGGVIVRSDGAEWEELDVLIDPEQPLDAIITKITGLRTEDLKGARTFPAAWSETIAPWLAGVDAIVAHNLPFDGGVLAAELRRAGIAWEWPRGRICTVELFAPEWGRRMKLVELYAAITGTRYAQTHRGLDDARALATIVERERLWECVPPPGTTGCELPEELRCDMGA